MLFPQCHRCSCASGLKKRRTESDLFDGIIDDRANPMYRRWSHCFDLFAFIHSYIICNRLSLFTSKSKYLMCNNPYFSCSIIYFTVYIEFFLVKGTFLIYFILFLLFLLKYSFFFCIFPRFLNGSSCKASDFPLGDQ